MVMSDQSKQLLVEKFIDLFGIWEFPLQYLPLVVEKREMQLIVGMAGESITSEKAAQLLGTSQDQASRFLERCYSRCILHKISEEGRVSYIPGDFYTRLAHFAKFEGWDQIQMSDRQTIDRSFLDQFISRHQQGVQEKMAGWIPDMGLPNDTIMLLSEVEEMIDAATDIIVQPCDCRRLGQNCDLPVETCIWLDESAREALDRGQGRRLTATEAKELIRKADKQGLMHTADSEWQSHGLQAICNCCACDCYPFRAAEELGSKGVWPKSRYIAKYDSSLCSTCGTCLERCHFEAFFYLDPTGNGDRTPLEAVGYDPEKCWGCGLCANTCPENAIQMEKTL
jgi:NAD-dependent dihydropyrimidine dehydrogenase PreA subunit